MNAQLPILGGHVLQGTDAPESMGFNVNMGNNVYICLQPDTREETEKLFKALAEGGEVEMELQDMFWGDYFGCLTAPVKLSKTSYKIPTLFPKERGLPSLSLDLIK
jgi:PhnB protein